MSCCTLIQLHTKTYYHYQQLAVVYFFYCPGCLWGIMLKYFLNLIVKNFRLLKLVFILATAYFIFEELNLFIYKKPTLISVSKSKIRAENLPNILICSLRGYDESELRKLGYKDSSQYTMGVFTDRKYVGWLGNQSGTSGRDVIRSISTIKTTQDCPTVTALFAINGTLESRDFLSSFLTRPIHLNGRCCRPKPPQLAKIHPIYELRIKYKETDNLHGFRVILSNPLTSTIFEQNKFQMEGINLDSDKSGKQI